MLMRLPVLCLSIVLFLSGVLVLLHSSFESSRLTDRTGEYAVEAVGPVKFTSERTYIRLRVFDYGNSPEFLKFRNQPVMHSGSQLLVPKRSGTVEGAWSYQLFSADIPAMVEFPKPGNNEHEAEITLAFQALLAKPFGAAVPSGAEVNELWLKLEDFNLLQVRRKWPVSADGSMFGALQSFLLEHISEGWAWVFCLLGVAGAITSAIMVFLALRKRKRVQILKTVTIPKQSAENEKRINDETAPKAPEVLLPNDWDEDEIAISIRKLEQEPPALASYLDHVRERFIILQNERTAKKRVDFLKQHLDQAKVTKELRSTINELRLTGLNFEIEELKLQIERDGLKNQKSTQPELAKLEQERDSLRIQVDIAQSKQTIRNFKAAAKKPKELTPAEQREKEKLEVREQIRQREARIQEIENDGGLTQASKYRQINILNHTLEELHEKLEHLERM